MKIILDAGHGAGKEHNRGGLLFNEGDQNYKFSLTLKKALERYDGIEALLTRKNGNDNPSLRDRGRMYTGDLFLSLHSNAAQKSVRGCEIWESVKDRDHKLAEALVRTISTTLKTPNRGVKERFDGKHDWYGVLYFSKSTHSMIIEHVFHTNREDSEVYLAKQNELAEAMAKTIADYYQRKLKASNQAKARDSLNGLNDPKDYYHTQGIYLIKKDCNIHMKPQMSSRITGSVKKGDAFTIIEVKVKSDNSVAGKLKSGKGWITLKDTFVRRLKRI